MDAPKCPECGESLDFIDIVVGEKRYYTMSTEWNKEEGKYENNLPDKAKIRNVRCFACHNDLGKDWFKERLGNEHVIDMEEELRKNPKIGQPITEKTKP